jgi:hypothetical protein
MSDYVNCPACGGRGVLPLEEAQRIEEHAVAGRKAMLERQAADDAAMHKSLRSAQGAREYRPVIVRRTGPETAE